MPIPRLQAITLISILCCLTAAPLFGQTKTLKPKITAEQANAIAVKKYHGKVVGKTKLENEEGKWQYGVLVRSGKTLREVMVNAKTGKIDNVEVTTATKEKAEEKADAAKANKKH